MSPGLFPSHDDLCHQKEGRNALVVAVDLRSARATFELSIEEALCNQTLMCTCSLKVKSQVTQLCDIYFLSKSLYKFYKTIDSLSFL